MTTKPFTKDALEALEHGELRRIFSKTTGLGPGIRKQSTLIEGILAAQTEVAPGDDDRDDDKDEGSIENATVTASQEPTTVPDGSDDDPEPQGDQEHEPVKVKVSGTGSNEGSVLLCDLVSFTGTVAVVRLLGTEVRFRASSGEPVRARKSWQTAGWVLDTDILPEMVEPSVEELVAMKPRDLSIAQLREVYRHLSGRTSASTSRAFLTNRIRQAKAGTLPRSTRHSRSGDPQKVLPVSMPVSTVEALDAAWRRLGFPSRIAFIRKALADKLQAEGEDAVAEMVLR